MGSLAGYLGAGTALMLGLPPLVAALILTAGGSMTTVLVMLGQARHP
ncbi:hypothetical protein L0V05_19985 [Tabrizicola sp. J26]|nr:hypothetical protein [Tabrizicola rongguiensis]MCF1711094.1 hypothetical protein [Tabrizicola rongguiensis]